MFYLNHKVNMLLQIKKYVAVTCNFAFGTNALEYCSFFGDSFTLQITGIDFARLSSIVLYIGQPGHPTCPRPSFVKNICWTLGLMLTSNGWGNASNLFKETF